MNEKNILNKLRENPFGIENIENPSNEMKLIAVKSNGLAIRYIKGELGEDIKREAIISNPLCVEYINDLSEDLLVLAVKNLWNSLKLIKNPSNRVIEEAVKTKGWALQFVNEPWEELCVTAVKRDYDAIKYISNPSERVQLEAINTHWGAIKFIKNPTLASKIAAIKGDEESINYIANYDLDELKIFMKENLRVVKYIYESIDVELVVEVLMEKFKDENTEYEYIREFINLEILEMDKINFIREYGSKKAKRELVRLKLEMN
ncbi:MAG: hypothetical protein ACRC7N_00255 [Clostridium sp.]